MKNDEKTNDLEVEIKDEETVEESAKDTEEETEESQSETEEESDEEKLDPQEEITKWKSRSAKYQRLFEKEQKKNNGGDKDHQSSEVKQKDSSPSVEETVLRAQGMPDELLKTLKKVAAVNGVSLLDAQKDELFVAAKEKYEKSEKSKRSSVRSSNGSSKSVEKPTFSSKNLTDEQHKELWEQEINR